MINPLFQTEEEIVLVNHTTGETKEFVVRNLEDVAAIKEAQAQVEDGEFELQYLRGCLVGEACDYFLDLCELVHRFKESLDVIGKLFNACDGLEDTMTLLENEAFMVVRAKDDTLAYREYLEESGQLDGISARIRDYIDYRQWLTDDQAWVVQTQAVADDSDHYEYVIYRA